MLCQTWSWVYLGEYFWIRLAFESIDRIKQITSPVWWASSNQLKTWIEQKGKVIENFFVLIIGLGHQSFSLDSGWNIGSSWVSSLPAFRLELPPSLSWDSIQNDSISSPGFLASCLHIYDHRSQFLIIKLFLHVCLYLISSISLKIPG